MEMGLHFFYWFDSNEKAAGVAKMSRVFFFEKHEIRWSIFAGISVSLEAAIRKQHGHHPVRTEIADNDPEESGVNSRIIAQVPDFLLVREMGAHGNRLGLFCS